MSESEIKLGESVKHVVVEGRDVYLVGTAHISKESVEDVRSTVEAVEPDTICVELCEGRYKAMTQRDAWKNMNIFKVIREKKGVFLLAQLVMSAFYRKLGEKFGVEPGAEMTEAIKLAEQTKATLVLADRDVQITLKRVWGYLGFWNKMKMPAHVIAGLLEKEELDEEMIEEIKHKDQLENVLEEFAKKFPGIKRRLIDERDIYLSQKIRQTKGEKIVAVVGAGHVQGITEHIQKDEPLDELLEIPRKSATGTILKWAIPAAIIAVFAIGFFRGDLTHLKQSVWIWVLINGGLSAVGAAVALGHPVTILSAFLGAPMTSLNPLMAAGWVAGFVQALVRRPKVADFEDLPNAIQTAKGFWSNPVTKILLVVVLANIGSVLGTFIAGTWITARTL